jgi:hypothetical protein
MSNRTREDTDQETASSTEVEASPQAVSSDYKTRGKKAAAGGTGILGHNTATSGESHGVEGVTESEGNGAAGVRGAANATSGTHIGVYGTGASTDAQGVVGAASSSEPPLSFTGLPTGVWGYTDRSGDDTGVDKAYGVYASSTASSGKAYAVYANNNSPDGYAVYSEGDCRIEGYLERDTIGASVSLSSSQSIPSSSATRVAYDTVGFNDGGWNPNANEYVIPRDGTYQFNAHLDFKDELSEGTFLQLTIMRDAAGGGTTSADIVDHQVDLPESGGSVGYAAQLSRTVQAAKDETIYVEVWQTDSGSKNLSGLSSRNFFDVTQVG